MHTQSDVRIEVALSSFGRAAPTELDEAERLLYQFECMLERRPDDSHLVRLVSQLQERVDVLGMQDLAAQLQSVH